MQLCFEMCSVPAAGATQMDEKDSSGGHDLLQEWMVWLSGTVQHSRTPGSRELGHFGRKEPSGNRGHGGSLSISRRLALRPDLGW